MAILSITGGGMRALDRRHLSVRSDSGAPAMESEQAGPARSARGADGVPPAGARRRADPGLAILGLLIFAAGAAVLLVSALSTGDGVFITIALIMLAVPLILATLAWRFGAWALVLATIGGALGVLGNVPAIVHGVATPDSFFDFVPALCILVGGLVAAIGGGVALIRGRRRTDRAAAGGVPRGAAIGLAGVLGALAVLSLLLTFAGREEVAASAKAGTVPVEVKDGLYATDRLEVAAGTPARLLVKNDDLAVHSFTIKELGIDRGLGPASEYIIELPALRPGTYTYICNVPNHEAMKGTLVVQ